MKYNYCSRCNLPSKKLFNCKYEKHEEDCFLLCSRCALECRNIYKKAFKKKAGNLSQLEWSKQEKIES